MSRVVIDESLMDPEVTWGRRDALNVALGTDQPYRSDAPPRVIVRGVGLHGGTKSVAALTVAQARAHARRVLEAADRLEALDV